jgi:hypothetical protein
MHAPGSSNYIHAEVRQSSRGLNYLHDTTRIVPRSVDAVARDPWNTTRLDRSKFSVLASRPRPPI